MEPISEELKLVLAKVGPVSGSHVHIGGIPYGVHVDITPDDLRVIVKEIEKLPQILDRNQRITNYELGRIFGTANETNKFMFCCCLLQNFYGTPIFMIHQEGSYDRLRYMGEMKNIVIEEKAVEETDSSSADMGSIMVLAVPTTAEGPKGNIVVKKTRKPRAIKASKTVKETKPASKRKKTKK